MRDLGRFLRRPDFGVMMDSRVPIWMDITVRTASNHGRKVHKRNRYSRVPPYMSDILMMMIYRWNVRTPGIRHLKAIQEITIKRRVEFSNDVLLEVGFLLDGRAKHEKVTDELIASIYAANPGDTG